MLKLFIAQILQNSVNKNKTKTLVRKILFRTLENFKGVLGETVPQWSDRNG